MAAGYTRFNPDGTTTWVTGADFDLSALLPQGTPPQLVLSRTNKPQRRRAKARLAQHRARLRAEVDTLNSWGSLKRDYEGPTRVGAMARDMDTCSGGHWCPPMKTVMLRASAVTPPSPDA